MLYDVTDASGLLAEVQERCEGAGDAFGAAFQALEDAILARPARPDAKMPDGACTDYEWDELGLDARIDQTLVRIPCWVADDEATYDAVYPELADLIEASCRVGAL